MSIYKLLKFKNIKQFNKMTMENRDKGGGGPNLIIG